MPPSGATTLRPAFAADKSVKVGINLSLTGADAESAKRIEDGALMAIEQANKAKAVPGYKIEVAEAGRRHRDGRPV